jgi:hypothetical protein
VSASGGSSVEGHERNGWRSRGALAVGLLAFVVAAGTIVVAATRGSEEAGGPGASAGDGDGGASPSEGRCPPGPQEPRSGAREDETLETEQPAPTVTEPRPPTSPPVTTDGHAPGWSSLVHDAAPPAPPSTEDVPADYPCHHPQRIEAVRTAGDGSTLVIVLTGGTHTDPAGFCYDGYTASVSGDPSRPVVSVWVHVHPGPMPDDFGCTLAGMARYLTVDLERPLDGADVVDGATGDPIEVFDGRLLPTPGDLPPGVTAHEGGFEGGWSMTWPVGGGPRGTLVAVFLEPPDLAGSADVCEAVEVRGRPGQLCSTPADELSDVPVEQRVLWEEGGVFYRVMAQDALAVAEELV